jgi:hypothetical protein
LNSNVFKEALSVRRDRARRTGTWRLISRRGACTKRDLKV